MSNQHQGYGLLNKNGTHSSPEASHSCNSSPRGTKSSSRNAGGDIEHSDLLSDHLKSLCQSEEYSDVVFLVEGQKLFAHKVILAARSDYFRALLYGGLKESSQTEIELNAPLEAFKALLDYIYTGHMNVSAMKQDTVLDALGLAHIYNFVELVTAISNYLRHTLSLSNVCAILDVARLYSLQSLVRVCHSFMDLHANQILKLDSLMNLSQAALTELLSRDSFYISEVEIFHAVCKWIQVNQPCSPSSSNSSVMTTDCSPLSAVRLTLMSVKELLNVVRPVGLMSPDALLDAIEERTRAKYNSLPHRGQLLVGENVASVRRGATVISGELQEYLLSGDTHSYDMERGYTRHAIGETSSGSSHSTVHSNSLVQYNTTNDTHSYDMERGYTRHAIGEISLATASKETSGIIVQFESPSIINHIKMLLWDKDLRSYSYYIELSMEQKNWIRVIDHSKHHCRSWQHLYFEPRVVKYIRIVGTNNTVNKFFHVVALEARYTFRIPKLSKGFVVPQHNVATLELSATVIEGVSRSRNALLNGDTQHYDWDSGYTCHQLGSGSILVQLGQPYMISSIRLLLWDCDERSYGYYIETSVNMWSWELVADKTRVSCKSWQTLRFDPRPVVFIRIVGTHNTANEVFHCVHLECPAQKLATTEEQQASTSESNPVAKEEDAAPGASAVSVQYESNDEGSASEPTTSSVTTVVEGESFNETENVNGGQKLMEMLTAFTKE